MKKFLVVSLFTFLSLAACGKDGCSMASCDTVAKTPVTYTGEATASKPYLAMKDMILRERGCTGNTCSYWTGLSLVVHNPTNDKIHVVLRCSYFIDNGVLGTPYTAKTDIPAKSSRTLEGFDLLFDLPAGIGKQGIFAECTGDFGPKYGLDIVRSH